MGATRREFIRGAAALGGAVLCGDAAAAVRFPKYTITDLGPSPVPFTRHLRLDGNGVPQLAGTTLVSGSDMGFRWSPGLGAVPIGTLGHPVSFARGINAAGTVVGEVQTAEGPRLPVLFSTGDVLSQLAVLPGDDFGGAGAINDAGVIAGFSSAAGRSQAIRWINGVPEALETPGTFSGAGGINSLGQICGTTMMPPGAGDPTRAFLWDPVSGYTDLGEFPRGSVWYPVTLSDAAHVIGVGALDKTPSVEQGFIWHSSTGIRLLPPFKAKRASIPNDVNASGQVVGHASDGKNTLAVTWVSGKIADLNKLIPKRSGWRLTAAHSIDAAGNIVGTGFLGNIYRLFKLNQSA
jgi:uncharacterized membrane protein